MNGILDYIAQETNGKNYKSYKFCFDSIDVPKIIYDDKREIKAKQFGETDKIKTPKSLEKLSNDIAGKTPLFKYFLDGSRRTYKVDDIAYDKKLYPIIAGQIGVAICERETSDNFKAYKNSIALVLSLPSRANAKTQNDNLFYNNLTEKLNKLDLLDKKGVNFSNILPYDDSPLKGSDKYEDKGIAKIQDEMIALEKKAVFELVKKKKLNQNTFLVKDGSLEYLKMKRGDLKDLSAIKSNYSNVIGVSKAFNPESLSNDIKDISRIIADLKLFHRTPAFLYETPRIPEVKFSVWYLRIRKTISPFDGVLKIEKILVWDKEEKEGLDSDEIDLISANIINERNPVCYGQDKRWAKHLYPVYLTEKYIKSKYLSDLHFINLF